MKKVIFLLSSTFFAFCTLLSGVCGSFFAKPVKAETELPSYFAVTHNGNAVANNGTILMGTTNSDVVKISLNENNTVALSNFINTEINLNGEILAVADIKQLTSNGGLIEEGYIIEEHEGGDFAGSYYLTLSLVGDKVAVANKYGKYDISMSYYITSQGNQLQTLSFSFILVKGSNYNVATLQFNNAEQGGGINGYNKDYVYKFATEEMPVLTFNHNHFDVLISKTSGRDGLEEQNITVLKNSNGENQIVSTGSELVVCSLDGDNIKIVFTNIAEYDILYTAVYKSATEKHILLNQNASAKNLIKDKLTISGFALFYSNASADTTSININAKEFKQMSTNGLTTTARTDYTYLLTNNPTKDLENLLIDLNSISNFKPQSTNQMPLQFMFSDAIVLNNDNGSKVWKLNYNDSNYLEIDGNENGVNLTLEYFTGINGGVGMYAVNVVSSTDTTATNYQSQWFVFEITNTIPTQEIKTTTESNIADIDNLATLPILSTGNYTNKNVVVKYASIPSIFDKATKLIVTQYNFNKTSVVNTKEVSSETPELFTENGYYTVVISSNGTEVSRSNFVIDKQAIENYALFNVIPSSSSRFKQSTSFDYLTNQSIALSWQNKTSGAVVSCEYKFFPFEKMDIENDYLTYFNQSNALEAFYHNPIYSYSIPTLYQLRYKASNPTILYNQPTNLSSISSASIFKDTGLYIFRLFDQAGEETYLPVIIDKIAPVILQENAEGHFEEIQDINTVSSDTKVYWGQNKLIKLLDAEIGQDNDAWLNSFIDKTEYATYSLATQTSNYIKIKINPNVYQSVNSGIATLIPTNKILYFGTSIETIMNGEPQENEYKFFVRDKSNTLSGINVVDTYTYYASAVHTIKVSFDASKTDIYYKNDSNLISLSQSDYANINKSTSTKTMFYNPTNENTFTSDEKVYIRFIDKPTENVIEVESVICEYYPFEHTVVDGVEKYDYATTAQNTFNVFTNEENIITNDLTNIDNEYRVWEVYSAYDSKTNTEITKEGKYVITRTYKNFGSSNVQINENNDFMTRKFVFYVEKSGIVSLPQTLDSGITKSVIGEGIQLRITDSYFKDIYIAQNYNDTYKSEHAGNSYSGSTKTIITTNKLPVKVLIPFYQFGVKEETAPTNPNSFTQSINASYFENDKIISYNTLKATIYKYGNVNLQSGTLVYTTPANSSLADIATNGYLNIPAIKDAGFYEVIISQNDPTAPKYVFVFEVRYQAPNFTVYNMSEQELESINTPESSIYFTNKSQFKIAWTDDPSEYMAKIDKTKIQYYVVYKDGNVSSYRTMPAVNINEANLDLENLFPDTYQNISQVKVILQYEGNNEDFSGYFSTEKTIQLDNTAPTENITKLITNTSLTQYENQIRDTSNSIYNISKTTGNMKYFAFPVDVSELSSLISVNRTLGTEAYNVWFRRMEQKYTYSAYQETDPVSFVATSEYKIFNDSNISSYMRNRNYYYEIIEKDLAGNLTIYTIYLVDKANENEEKEVISWINQSSDTDNIILQKDISSTITLYSKHDFNLTDIKLFKNETNNGYPWYLLNVNGKTYVHTPYNTDNMIYDGTNEVALSAITKLPISSAMHTITISNVPYYKTITLSVGVLSESNDLNILHISSITNLEKDSNTGEYIFLKADGDEDFRVKEAILIEIPTQSREQASVYATKVDITQNSVSLFNFEKDINSIENVNSIPKSDIIMVKTYYDGAKHYIVLSVEIPRVNTYYIYTITDNFGDKYTKSYIYGQEYANETWVSTVPILNTVIDQVNWNFATDTIKFEFNNNKDILSFIIDGTEYSTADSEEMANLSEGVKNDDGQTLVKITKTATNSVVYRVEIFAINKDRVVSGIYGGQNDMIVNIYTKTASKILTYSTNVRVYNILPEINLIGKNNENLNQLFIDKTMIVGKPITIKFASTEFETYPINVYLKNNTTGEVYSTPLTSGYVINEAGDYSLILKYSALFTNESYDIIKTFNIRDDSIDFFKVYTSAGEVHATGKTFTYIGTSGNLVTIYSHYIVNEDYVISCNQAQKISVTSDSTHSSNGVRTYIYNISNHNQHAVGYNLNYFQTKIAVTVVAKTNNIISKFSKIASNGEEIEYNRDATIIIEKLTPADEDYLIIAWTAYFGIKENEINLTLIGENNTILNPNVTLDNGVKKMKLEISGYYYLQFKDMAGNIHYFNNLSTMPLTFLSSVIYNINGQSPIDNAIYDSSVLVTIPASSLSLYDNNAVPKIKIMRNGIDETPNRANAMEYVLSLPGQYTISFSALVSFSATNQQTIKEKEISFVIINSNETRWAYELQEFSNYYISKILKNGIDITESLSNENIGEILTVNEVNENGILTTKRYLKNILISLYDEQTGAGKYQLTVKTNDILNTKYEFAFWINNAQPPISISVPEGTNTVDEIFVEYNLFNLYDSVGDCFIKVNKFQDINLNQEFLDSLAEGDTGSVKMELKEAGTYYVQIFSQSGNLLYSYSVVKVEPLNGISILIIVLAALAVVGLIILFVLLRKRMKVR